MSVLGVGGEDIEQLHSTRTTLCNSLIIFLVAVCNQLKKKSFRFPRRTAENAQIPAFGFKSSLSVEDLGLLSGSWWTYSQSRSLGSLNLGPARCPAGAELTSDPAAPGLSTPGTPGARTCTIPHNSLTHPQQLRSNTKGHFKILSKLNLKFKK